MSEPTKEALGAAWNWMNSKCRVHPQQSFPTYKCDCTKCHAELLAVVEAARELHGGTKYPDCSLCRAIDAYDAANGDRDE